MTNFRPFFSAARAAAKAAAKHDPTRRMGKRKMTQAVASHLLKHPKLAHFAAKAYDNRQAIKHVAEGAAVAGVAGHAAYRMAKQRGEEKNAVHAGRLMRGPNGGTYYVGPSGNKIYVKR
jgi:hypothetical protein